MSHYTNTNRAYQWLEENMDHSRGTIKLVQDLMEAVKEERDATQKEIASLRHESSIKAHYIQELEKTKGVNQSIALEKIERDLIRLINSATDALADVTKLRSSQ
jgi:hypothetical protein